MGKQHNIFYRLIVFIAYSNVFISICAASVVWYTHLVFKEELHAGILWITFGCTFVLYNTQQLFLSFLTVRKTSEYEKWLSKNALLLALMAAVAISEIYPLFTSTLRFLLTYAAAAAISLLYFLPFSNLRAIPFLKSFIIGIVWVFICVMAPIDTAKFDMQNTFFWTSQLLFITALCVLFNIRDMEHDHKAGTYTVPVLYGASMAKIFTVLLLSGYAVLSYLAIPRMEGLCVTLIVFLASCLFTWGSSSKKHSFYYLYGVDGLILLQSILGFVFLRS